MKVDDFHQVRLSKITLAKDDRGDILEMKESFFGDSFSKKGEFEIKMSNPPRYASKISIISGEFEYFQPSEATKSKILVQQPLNKTNVNLLDQSNKDTKLLLLDKKELEELMTKSKKEYEAKLNELKSNGILGEGMATGVDALAKFFEGIWGYDDKEENQLSFFLQDPNKIW